MSKQKKKTPEERKSDRDFRALIGGIAGGFGGDYVGEGALRALKGGKPLHWAPRLAAGMVGGTIGSGVGSAIGAKTASVMSALVKTAAKKDAPNYRKAESPAKSCGTCKFFKPKGDGTGLCTAYDFTCHQDMTCDSWKGKGKEKSAFIGAVSGALSAEKGRKWEGAGKGFVGGDLVGGTVGALGGAALGAAAGGRSGAVIGQLAGGLTGSVTGGHLAGRTAKKRKKGKNLKGRTAQERFVNSRSPGKEKKAGAGTAKAVIKGLALVGVGLGAGLGIKPKQKKRRDPYARYRTKYAASSQADGDSPTWGALSKGEKIDAGVSTFKGVGIGAASGGVLGAGAGHLMGTKKRYPALAGALIASRIGGNQGFKQGVGKEKYKKIKKELKGASQQKRAKRRLRRAEAAYVAAYPMGTPESRKATVLKHQALKDKVANAKSDAAGGFLSRFFKKKAPPTASEQVAATLKKNPELGAARQQARIGSHKDVVGKGRRPPLVELEHLKMKMRAAKQGPTPETPSDILGA